MKKLYILLFLINIAGWAAAQNEVSPPTEENKAQQNIEALKVAFITKELELTPEEAQKFWPIYNQYSKELRDAVKNNPDVIDRDEKVLNLRKQYREQFTKVLGQQRMNRMFGAESRFREVLIKTMRRQQRMQQNRPNHPPLRQGQ